MIVILLSNCVSNKKPESESSGEVTARPTPWRINFPDSGKDTLKVSFIADTVIHIPLETTEESFMDFHNIHQIWMDDSYILIHCELAGLLLFKQDGKFVGKIGNRGRGPGEHGNIFHFEVISDTIYVSSSGRRGFLRYTFDETFCDEIKLNYQPIYFSTTINQKLACYVLEEGKVLVYNEGLFLPPDTIVVEYDVTEGRYNFSFISDKSMAYLQKTSSGLLFYDYMSDTVWNIAGNKKEPAYIVNMKNKLPRENHIEFCNGNLRGWSQMVESYQFVHFLPFPSLTLIYQKHWRGGRYDAIYVENPKTGEIRKFNKPWIYDDIVSFERLWVYEYVYSDEYLVAITFLPEQDDSQKSKDAKGTPSPIWLEQIKTLTEFDNPIFVKIKLKENL